MRATLSRVLPFLVIAAVAVMNFAEAGELRVTVEAGGFERENAPIRLDVPESALGESARAALRDGPVALPLVEEGQPDREQVAQVDRAEAAGGAARLTFVLEGKTPSCATRRFRLALNPRAGEPCWSLTDRGPGVLELKNRGRSVFRYNTAPVAHPNYGPIQRRDAYIHPAFTPTGNLITGDFSKFHPHHRGFFLAYAKTQVGPLGPDFWNIHVGSGKVHFEAIERAEAGPVVARLVTRHRWSANGAGDVLRESWEIEAYDIPGQPYWLFDLTSTQRAEGPPVVVKPHRYGGMAYRGPEPFVKGPLDVLTSEGRGRRDGDQKPARWVDLTGPVEDGGSVYGGALIADHPSNLHHPNVARIHPTTLPFFSYVPAYKDPVTIAPDAPSVFRYRVVIHDGRPDRDRDERIWRDFAEPPRATLEPEARGGGGELKVQP